MNKRHSNRITIGLKAEIISDDVHYGGVIDNISEDGMFVITDFEKNPVNFTPGSTVKVKFQFLSQEMLVLDCTVQWSFKTPPHGLTTRMGLKIIDPPWKMDTTSL